MVEDRVTDGKRIAELLASELTGLATGPLDRIAVVDADRDAEPSEAGSFAYGVSLDDERLGDVYVHAAYARVDLVGASAGTALNEPGADDGPGEGDGVMVGTTDDGHPRLVVEYGAAVKRVVDALVDVANELDEAGGENQ